MDIEGFMRRIGVSSKTELAKMLDSKPQNINKWFNKDRKEPTYEMCKRLLKIGMTVEELFGPEVAAKVAVSNQEIKDKQTAYNPNINFDDPAVQAGITKALSDVFAKAAANKG